MMKLSLLTLFLFGSLLIQAQNRYCELKGSVFETTDRGLADFIVFEEESEAFADFLVFEEESRLYADRSGLWYFVDNRGLANFAVFFTKEKSESHFSVYFTETSSFAGCN